MDKIPDDASKIKTLRKTFAQIILAFFATAVFFSNIGAGCGIGGQYVSVVNHFWCPRFLESWPAPINRPRKGDSLELIQRILRWEWIFMKSYRFSVLGCSGQHWNLGIWSPGVGLIYGSKTPTANSFVWVLGKHLQLPIILCEYQVKYLFPS